LHFEDETVSPTFSTDVRLKEARLTGVNSLKPEQSSPLTLEASSRKYTRINLQGNIQPFTERISMDLKGKLKAIEMPPLSPYAVKTLGYNLISGEMDADIDLKVVVGKLGGEGDLKFYNPIIEAVDPEKLKNEKGMSIPLQSALKVLRDKDDDVRLKIPISGDVSDPKFSFSDAINQAVIKGLTMATLSYLKYMLGPYGTAIAIVEIGAKVGAKALTGIRLKPVEFQPGASDLDATAQEYLDKLAAILKEKKDLRVRLCGWATESDRMGPRAAAPEAAESSGSEPLEKKSAPGKQSAALKVPALSDEAMLALAERRADLIEDILVGQHGIKDKRIFICKPEIDKNPDAKPRVELVF
jgi:outer membrane protein OmpA-like peptidoglycan-associated protein